MRSCLTHSRSVSRLRPSSLGDLGNGLVAGAHQRHRVTTEFGWVDGRHPERPLDSRAANSQAVRETGSTPAGTVARLARQLIEQCRRLTAEINDLTREIERLAIQAALSLLALPGCAALTAAKIIGETAGSTGSNPGTPAPATTAPRRCRCGHRTAAGIDSAGQGIVSSTPLSTASRSPRPTGTPTPEPSSTNAERTETAASKHSARSNDVYQMSSTAPSTTTSPSRSTPPLDRGAVDRPQAQAQTDL
jgi:hypothetical protein